MATNRIKKRDAPGLYYGGLPESQGHAHQLVGHALDMMNHYFESFRSSIKLHDYCMKQLRIARGRDKRQLLRHWQFMAARDGAFSIFHFNWAIEGLSDSLHQCPYLTSRMDKSVVRKAKKQFHKAFPNATEVRNAIGHSGEKARNPDKHREHGFTGVLNEKGLNVGKVRNYVVTDHLHRRWFCNTWKGKLESYKISEKSLADLAAVRDQIFDAFDAMNASSK